MDVDEIDALVTDLRAFRRHESVTADISAYITKLEDGVLSLADRLLVEKAEVAGLKAVFAAFYTQHPDSELLVPIGEFCDSDAPRRSKLRCDLIYETAFDEAAHQKGIANPRSKRIG